MTKREPIEALEALDCSDDTDINILENETGKTPYLGRIELTEDGIVLIELGY